MSGRGDYTQEEWATLERAPFAVGMAISLSDKGGPIELTKETMAVLRSASAPPAQDELLVAVSQGVLAQAKDHHNPIKDMKLEAPTAAQQLLDEVGRAAEIVDAKATPEEAAAYRNWMAATAQAVAEAAKEGGFMGIGAVRVSQGEATMIEHIRQRLGVS
jgi:hypothetical protein